MTDRAIIVTDGDLERLKRLVRLLGILFSEIKGSLNFSIRLWKAPKSGLQVEFPKM